MGCIDCKLCSELIDEYFDGILDADTHARFEEHVRSCETCASQTEAYRELMDQMKPLSMQHEPPEGFHAQWLQAVRRERLRKKRARFRTGMASAAALLVFLMSVGAFIGIGKGSATQEAASVQATARAADVESTMVSELKTIQPDANTKDATLQATKPPKDEEKSELFSGATKGDINEDVSDERVTGTGDTNTESASEAGAAQTGSAEAGVSGSGPGDTVGIQTIVLQAEDAQKAEQELLSLTDQNAIPIEQVAAGAFSLEINPETRPVIEPWLSGYTDEELPQDETFMLQITIEQK